MIRSFIALVFLAATARGAVEGPPKLPGEAFSPPEIRELRTNAAALLAPMPPKPALKGPNDAAMFDLGCKLYFDVRLSVNQSISCNTCHRLSGGGAGMEHRASSLSPYTRTGQRNAPTVLNAGSQFAQGWDGGSVTLEDFLSLHILDPLILANPKANEFGERLGGTPDYPAAFAKAFPGESPGGNLKQAVRALAVYVGQQTTRDRFDDFLAGDDRALNNDELNGLYRFLLAGCAKCHNGPLLGGNTFKKLGAVHPVADANDLGRINLTSNPEDRLVFKVPSLRNVALTAPYFHDGSQDTLEDAVRAMGRLQLPRKIGPEDVRLIAAFLKTLSDTQRVPGK